ncbi:MAG: TonB-dependent receptor domain-containing protein [Gammaproteobacteria bacterium]
MKRKSGRFLNKHGSTSREQRSTLRSWRRLSSLLAFALWQFTYSVHAEEACEQPAGRFASIEGSVDVQPTEAQSWRAAKLDDRLCEGDTIRVGEHSRAAVYLINDAVLRIDQSTTMRLLDVSEKKEERTVLNIIAGAFQSLSRQPRRLTVNTPYLNGMIEGTEFLVRVEDDRASLAVLEGKVLVSNAAGSLKVAPGESATAEAGKAPQLRTLVRPRDAVEWSLYYPPVLAVLGGHAGGAGVSPALSEALARAGRGDSSAAFQALDRIAEGDRDASFYLHRAALLLSVGGIDEARTDIDGALKRDPNAGLAYALRAIIQVVQNEREPALADAERAVSLSPTAAAKIALSYAQQADFRIEAARDTLLTAVQQHPGDALAWARLGELWLMLGERDKAREAAGKAASLAPDLARTQLVLGFAALAEFRNREARAAFERAIALSSADPLAHLGLGLAKISDGDLAEGRQEIEVASGLDSNSALLRAYLGKAYFEEKRDPLDAQQYSIAKELDPKDPTAYLYDGILKQTVNRPVEALQDLETSAALNDNRAVYRGRLLLDKDRAARGTSLARIHKDLGFTQLGVNDSTESLTLDPANASAHRFLSDTYLGVRRREIARVSELLQAQLLQDININPVQPSVSETNLNIVTIGGPATPGFNEFTPLFQQNSAKLDVAGFGGNNNTYGGEGVLTALYDRFSLSAGGYYYNSDGWRDNNDLRQHIYDFFAQAAITPELNVQAEFRRRDSEEGDLSFNFDRDDFLRDKTLNRDQDTARFGLRYSPTPRSDILLSYIHNDRDEKIEESEPLGDFLTLLNDSKLNDTGSQVEAQFLYRRDRLNVVAGGAYSFVDRTFDDFLLIPELSFPFVDELTHENIKHPHGYLYGNIRYPASVTWTLGVSYDYYDEDPLEETSVNPKFGVQWNITDDFRLRAAAFKTLKPALVNNRTIEPTQVAGFNQFFDDLNATKSWRFGGGFDWRLTPTLFLGGEITWRDLDEPIFLVLASGDEDVEFEDRDEQNHNVHLYWTPLDRWALKAEFVYDRYLSEKGIATEFDNLPEDVESFSVPIGVSYFHPLGIFATVGGTFVDQHVERAETASQADGTDSFFLVDLALGYRFPKRLGLVSIGVKNLFDIEFQYQDDSYREFRDEPSTGPYFPDRTLLARITLSF